MKFGIFYEHQLPRPWNEDSEYKLYMDALDQVELADKLGYYDAFIGEHLLEPIDLLDVTVQIGTPRAAQDVIDDRIRVPRPEQNADPPLWRQ